jgi:hypothetical protein
VHNSKKKIQGMLLQLHLSEKTGRIYSNVYQGKSKTLTDEQNLQQKDDFQSE